MENRVGCIPLGVIVRLRNVHDAAEKPFPIRPFLNLFRVEVNGGDGQTSKPNRLTINQRQVHKRTFNNGVGRHRQTNGAEVVTLSEPQLGNGLIGTGVLFQRPRLIEIILRLL